MAEAFISVVVQAIHEVLNDKEAQLPNGVQVQVKELLPKLDKLRTQLTSSSIECDIRLEERSIKNLAYGAQDVVEKYYVKIKSKSGVMKKASNARFACIPSDTITHHEVEKELKDINSSLADLSKTLADFIAKNPRVPVPAPAPALTSIPARAITITATATTTTATATATAPAPAPAPVPTSNPDPATATPAPAPALVPTSNPDPAPAPALVPTSNPAPAIAIVTAPAPPDPDNNFIGMEKDINELVSLVKDATKAQIVSLYGMYGSGKTALARKIYNHQDIRKHFKHFAWVCITQSCEHPMVLQDLFYQLTNEVKGPLKTYSEYLKEINDVFKEGHCFIVLDNIWSIKDRDILFRAFPILNGKGSKILLTTRIEEIASVGVIHHQRLLNAQDGLKLLIQKIGAKVQNADVRIGKSLELLGKEMVRRCGGVPLAISNLGNILGSRLSEKEWKMINKDIGSTLNQGSGSEVAAEALGLSYHDLPPYLKPCFLYMGLFGKDQNIDLRKLYHLWIAEGIVSEEHRKQDEATLIDVAERFLKELSSRCMAQIRKDPVLERLESSRLYDQMRGYCLIMAKEEGFLESVDMDLRGGQSAGVDTLIDDNVRRLVIHMNINPRDTRCVKPFEHITSNLIRALSFRCVKPIQHPSMSSNLPFFSMGKYTMEASLASHFKLLKVLDFVDCRFHGERLPSGVGQLVLLRYLSLRGCNVEELPSFVGDLPLLQTLDLRTRSTIKILAANIFLKMGQLRHLYLGNFKCGSGGMLQLDGLSQLETLVFEVDIYELKVSGLSTLTNIRYFKVNMLWNRNEWLSVIQDMQNWKKIKRLQVGISMVEGETLRLSLENDNITDLRLYRISSFMTAIPTTNPSCINLVSLDIISCDNVNDAVLELVSRFPKLRKLRCSAIKASLKEIKFVENSFPQLRSLELNDMMYLEKIEVEKQSLPNLIKLRVGGCEKLEIVPEDGLRFILMLKELEVNKNNMSMFKANCRKHHSHYRHVSIQES